MRDLLSKAVVGAMAIASIDLANAASTQVLRSHIPPVVAQSQLQPVGRLPGEQNLHIAINLPLRNDAELETLLQQIYDPKSPSFHHYLTPDQFAKRFAPDVSNYQAVIDYANSHGLKVTSTHPMHEIMGIDAKVADIENALHVHMVEYQHPTKNFRFYAPDVEPSLELDTRVQAISGLDNFTRQNAGFVREAEPRAQPRAGSGYSGNLLGYDFRHAYAFGVTNTGKGQVMGLVEADGSGFSGGGGYNYGDFQKYASLAKLPGVPPLYNVFQPNPPGEPGLDNAEFSLDVEMIMSMAPGLDAIVIYFPAGVATDEEMYQQMAYPTNGIAKPNQISTSWDVDTSPASTNYFRQMVVQGQSLFKFAGDNGAWIPTSANYPGYIYLTSVGGTDLDMTNNGAGWSSETVWGNQGPTGSPNGTGGGYIPGVSIPFYQDNTDMTASGGSQSYRNCPDVAAVASGIFIVDSFQPSNGVRQTELYVTNVGGTSASTPLWAAFTALVNQQAADEGLPPVGFINPALYEIGHSGNYANCFHDITVGNNEWSNSPTSFKAAVGYDHCTGWGTPGGAPLISALLGLGGPIFVDFNSSGTGADGSYYRPYNTIKAGTNAVNYYGTIFLMNGGTSSEKPTISKPMTITAANGASTIGK